MNFNIGDKVIVSNFFKNDDSPGDGILEIVSKRICNARKSGRRCSFVSDEFFKGVRGRTGMSREEFDKIIESCPGFVHRTSKASLDYCCLKFKSCREWKKL